MATLIAPDHFSCNEDAEALHKACKGWRTDEKAVISILAYRNAAQRYQIWLAYEELYHEDLIKRLESELSGDFEDCLPNQLIYRPTNRRKLYNYRVKKSLGFKKRFGVSSVVIHAMRLLSFEEEFPCSCGCFVKLVNALLH